MIPPVILFLHMHFMCEYTSVCLFLCAQASLHTGRTDAYDLLGEGHSKTVLEMKYRYSGTGNQPLLKGRQNKTETQLASPCPTNAPSHPEMSRYSDQDAPSSLQWNQQKQKICMLDIAQHPALVHVSGDLLLNKCPWKHGATKLLWHCLSIDTHEFIPDAQLHLICPCALLRSPTSWQQPTSPKDIKKRIDAWWAESTRPKWSMHVKCPVLTTNTPSCSTNFMPRRPVSQYTFTGNQPRQHGTDKIKRPACCLAV